MYETEEGICYEDNFCFNFNGTNTNEDTLNDLLETNDFCYLGSQSNTAWGSHSGGVPYTAEPTPYPGCDYFKSLAGDISVGAQYKYISQDSEIIMIKFISASILVCDWALSTSAGDCGEMIGHDPYEDYNDFYDEYLWKAITYSVVTVSVYILSDYTCPECYSKLNGKCVYDETIPGCESLQCPPGTVYNPETNTCELIGSPGSPPPDIPYEIKRTDHTCDVFYWEPYGHDTRLPWYMK